MSDIDIVQLISDMKSAASQIIGKDVSQIRGFAEEQLQAIARQADFVAAGVAEGVEHATTPREPVFEHIVQRSA